MLSLDTEFSIAYMQLFYSLTPYGHKLNEIVILMTKLAYFWVMTQVPQTLSNLLDFCTVVSAHIKNELV